LSNSLPFPCHVHHDAASLRSSRISLTICQLSLCLRCTRTAGSSLSHYQSGKDQSSHSLLAHASSSLAAKCDATRRRDIPCNIQRVYCTVISLADSRPFIVRQPSLAVRGSKSSRKKKDERQKKRRRSQIRQTAPLAQPYTPRPLCSTARFSLTTTLRSEQRLRTHRCSASSTMPQS
jgi:hypothetical protein